MNIHVVHDLMCVANPCIRRNGRVNCDKMYEGIVDVCGRKIGRSFQG